MPEIEAEKKRHKDETMTSQIERMSLNDIADSEMRLLLCKVYFLSTIIDVSLFILFPSMIRLYNRLYIIYIYIYTYIIYTFVYLLRCTAWETYTDFNQHTTVEFSHCTI